MNLFDRYIEELRAVVDAGSKVPHRAFQFDKKQKWPRLEREELILQQDTAVELGNPRSESCAFILYTGDLSAVHDGRISLYGTDIPEIGSSANTKSAAFGKVVLLGCDSFNEEEAYYYFEQMDMVRFRLKLEGYMLRGYPQRNREWSRISNRAFTKGLNLHTLGNELIRDYKELPFVKSAEVAFFTEETLIKELRPMAETCSKIAMALNKMFENITMDCKNCDASEVCDEIDGLKRMHKSLQK
jgi:CO dehydrogenase/acetyl-CoA synthase beta subunit